MSIHPRTLKDGTTVYDVRRVVGRDDRGKPVRKSITCATMSAAKHADAEMTIQQRNARTTLTLARYIESYYWPMASRTLADTSRETYRREINKRILPALGGRNIADITRQDVQNMVDACATRSVGRKAANTLKTILNEAMADGLIVANPAAQKLAMPPDGTRRDNGLVLSTFAQIDAMADIVTHSGSQCVQRVVMLGLYAGLRPEERYALDWRDIDMDARTLHVHAAYVTVTGGNVLKSPKTDNGTRIIPMHPRLHAWLVDIPRTDGAFIKAVDGMRISPSTARKRWTRFLDANADCPRVTLENMRHSFATAYLAAGGRVETLSRILGHSLISTTYNRYVRPNTDSISDEMSFIFG